MPNQFDKFSQKMLSSTSLGMEDFEAATPAPGPKKKGPRKATAPAAEKPTFEQTMAVKEAQNAARKGPGAKKGERKLVSFPVELSIIERIEFLSYKLGKSKQDFYDEALYDLLQKYLNI